MSSLSFETFSVLFEVEIDPISPSPSLVATQIVPLGSILKIIVCEVPLVIEAHEASNIRATASNTFFIFHPFKLNYVLSRVLLIAYLQLLVNRQQIIVCVSINLPATWVDIIFRSYFDNFDAPSPTRNLMRYASEFHGPLNAQSSQHRRFKEVLVCFIC
jgi:hypothetical protein